MLKVELCGEVDHIEFEGSFINAVADSTYIIRNLYNHYLEKSPIMAQAFRELVQETIADDSSPVWGKIGGKGGDGVRSVSIHFPKGFQGNEE